MSGKPGTTGGLRQGAGRPKGKQNKATLERIERERMAEQIATAAGHPGTGAAIAKAMDKNHPLARTELEEVLPILKGIVAHFQKIPFAASRAGQIGNKSDWDTFRTWLVLFIDTCTKLAPYQSPTFRAIAVTGPDPERQGIVRFVVENAPVMIEAMAVEG